MNFNGIYLHEDLCFNIFDYLQIKDKCNFMKINKYTYNNYYKYLKKEIYKFVHTDYILFKLFLYNINYDKYEIDNIGILSLQKIDYVYHLYNILDETKELKKLDLRYIFELIYLNFNIDNINNKLKYNELKFLCKKIKKCISFTRDLTYWNVLNHPCLYVLHYNFKGYFKNGKQWSKIKI